MKFIHLSPLKNVKKMLKSGIHDRVQPGPGRCRW